VKKKREERTLDNTFPICADPTQKVLTSATFHTKERKRKREVDWDPNGSLYFLFPPSERRGKREGGGEETRGARDIDLAGSKYIAGREQRQKKEKKKGGGGKKKKTVKGVLSIMLLAPT